MPVHFKSQKQTCTAINMKMVATEECMNKQFEQHVTHYWFVGKTILKSPSTEKKIFLVYRRYWACRTYCGPDSQQEMDVLNDHPEPPPLPTFLILAIHGKYGQTST